MARNPTKSSVCRDKQNVQSAILKQYNPYTLYSFERISLEITKIPKTKVVTEAKNAENKK